MLPWYFKNPKPNHIAKSDRLCHSNSNSRKDIKSLHPRFVFQLETSLVKLCYTHCSHCKCVENLPWNRHPNMLDLEGRHKNGCSRKAYTRIFIFLKKNYYRFSFLLQLSVIKMLFWKYVSMVFYSIYVSFWMKHIVDFYKVCVLFSKFLLTKQMILGAILCKKFYKIMFQERHNITALVKLKKSISLGLIYTYCWQKFIVLNQHHQQNCNLWIDWESFHY